MLKAVGLSASPQPPPRRALGRRAAACGYRPGAGHAPASCCSPTSRPATSTLAPRRGPRPLFRLNDEHKMTLLVVTHNMDLAWKVPRRIRMEDGRLVDDRPRRPERAPGPCVAGTRIIVSAAPPLPRPRSAPRSRPPWGVCSPSSRWQRASSGAFSAARVRSRRSRATRRLM
jgi:hypothetical protein